MAELVYAADLKSAGQLTLWVQVPLQLPLLKREGNMKKIITYIAAFAGIYIGVNWVADNPAKVKSARTQLNAAVEDGYDATAKFVKEQAK
jgi:hypothetical protein|tara:strand:- start:74 stop:343 length:270 start_codon:yes stop_codon:yes gene_type:complete